MIFTDRFTLEYLLFGQNKLFIEFLKFQKFKRDFIVEFQDSKAAAQNIFMQKQNLNKKSQELSTLKSRVLTRLV